jgi:hypothetical protein
VVRVAPPTSRLELVRVRIDALDVENVVLRVRLVVHPMRRLLGD